jgi:hypothetical protein
MITKNDPNTLLADKILTVLKVKGLIQDDADLKQLLIEGRAKDADWKLALENAINKIQSAADETTETRD